MRARLRRIAAAAALAAASLAVPAPAAGAATVFTGATLIDGTGAGPVADAAVVVEDGRIKAVGPADAVAIPQDAEVIDLTGTWLLPGFIDAHVHFFQSGGAYTRPDVIDLRAVRAYQHEIEWVRANVAATLARTLAAGVTGVADVGGPMWNFEVRGIAREQAASPRVAVAGPLLSTWMPEALKVADAPMVVIATAEDAVAEVRRQLALAPDLIKIWFVRPDRDIGGELEWVRAAIEEAHVAGVPVAVHATQQRVARAVVEAGADVLVHSVTDEVLDPETVALFAARGVLYVPTLAVNEGYRRVLGLHFAPTELELRVGAPEVLESFRMLQAMAPGDRPRGVAPAAPWQADPEAAANLRLLWDAGVTIAAGSDAGNIGTLHGAGLHRELELMVAGGGLTPAEALVAATRNGARLMGRADDLGTVEVGKLADFVVLRADPLVDIRNTRAVRMVVKGGVVVDPAAVLAGLGE